MAMSTLPALDDYLWVMAQRGRLIYVTREDAPWLICTFFILPSVDRIPVYHERSLWSTPQDFPRGTVLYIDKLIGRGFRRDLFRQMEAEITRKVPQWTTAVWYRPSPSDAPDRRYTYVRRTNDY